eukprot:scaffold8760_cov116-Isochrysis_galbana.AAC.9
MVMWPRRLPTAGQIYYPAQRWYSEPTRQPLRATAGSACPEISITTSAAGGRPVFGRPLPAIKGTFPPAAKPPAPMPL